MSITEFLNYYKTHEGNITRIYKQASKAHAEVNQTYGENLPYSFHLRLAASYVNRFGHLILQDESEIETLYAAIYFHDALEDARLTYNDLVKVFNQLNDEGAHIDTLKAAEAVYALTNDKGRNRAERAGEKYYEGIRSTHYASFLKMCDRLANLRYSTLFGFQQRMTRVYREEFPHFIASIGQVPQEMIAEAERLMQEGWELD